jgi:hypothetical protein
MFVNHKFKLMLVLRLGCARSCVLFYFAREYCYHTHIFIQYYVTIHIEENAYYDVMVNLGKVESSAKMLILSSPF